MGREILEKRKFERGISKIKSGGKCGGHPKLSTGFPQGARNAPGSIQLYTIELYTIISHHADDGKVCRL